MEPTSSANPVPNPTTSSINSLKELLVRIEPYLKLIGELIDDKFKNINLELETLEELDMTDYVETQKLFERLTEVCMNIWFQFDKTEYNFNQLENRRNFNKKLKSQGIIAEIKNPHSMVDNLSDEKQKQMLEHLLARFKK